MPAPVKPGAWYRAIAVLVIPVLRLLTRRDWQGGEHLPRSGGCLVVGNHLSYLDTLTLADFTLAQGRPVRYLAKSSLFSTPLLGTVMRRTGHIPTYRGTADAAQALRHAVTAIERGEAVAVLPEGTLTRDPRLWPMTGKTGAARIALTTGCPVIPTAQWGPQELLPPYGRPRPFPRKTMRCRAGAPVDLSEFHGRELTAAVLREATEKIMAAVVAQLEHLRGETAPTERFDPRTRGVTETGRPRRTDEGERA